MADLYLIEKRGLYYRPNAAGYTGIKSEAGRYTLDEVALHFPNMDSPNQDGMTFIAEADAPFFTKNCGWDGRLYYYRQQNDRAVSLMRQAHAVMRQCGWQIATATETDGDGVLELAAAEIEDAFSAFLNEVPG